MPEPKVFVRLEDGTEADVTVEVRCIYELLCSSMDYGSGFLSIEDVTTMTRLALAAGYETLEEAADQLAAYLRTAGGECPTCKASVQRWEQIDVTPTARIVRAAGHKACGHDAILSTVPGEPAGLKAATVIDGPDISQVCAVCGVPLRPESGEFHLAERPVCWACFTRIAGSGS